MSEDVPPYGVTAASSSARSDSGYYAPYAEFSKALRTWFLAYGVGAPVFLLSHDSIADKLVIAKVMGPVASLFAFGVAVQIVLVLAYKLAMWQLYVGELDPSHISTKAHRRAEWISNAWFLDVIGDFGTLGVFSYATWLLWTNLGVAT